MKETTYPNSVLFTQYLMPDGRQVPVMIDRPDDIVAIARNFAELGGKFEIEMLSDYTMISMTAELGDDVIAHELCVNGPDIPAAVDRLVMQTQTSRQAAKARKAKSKP